MFKQEASMRVSTLVAVAFAVFTFGGAAFAQPLDCSRTEPSGERTLCHEEVIDAPVAEVWRLFTTNDGLSSWLGPVVAIDLRPGGMMEASYDRNARLGLPGNIFNRVIGVAPERLLVIQVANAPEGFPHADLVETLATEISFEPIDASRTRVRVTMFGYRDGEDFDALYRFFARGNARTLTALAARAVNGPTDWSAAP
jgi:uncharacterized protein YndB with AHSA1/START domain